MLNIGTVRRIRLAATDSFPPQPLGSKTINVRIWGGYNVVRNERNVSRPSSRRLRS